ncbi:MAG: DUF324 domain containing Cmr2-like protein [Candidatus Carbobacillus altaicus]|uniref:DUF324 domain containing Cmr2-like protein n=1 Tax=Candidatus Carbonibacillus altaicus TaxID=2163959 RepID=A0A2R6Y3N1_9BACL|nr:MAG: DUF324 domain containing Cmr2-like protein [Candidatus Carbobacillus altaicus]
MSLFDHYCFSDKLLIKEGKELDDALKNNSADGLLVDSIIRVLRKNTKKEEVRKNYMEKIKKVEAFKLPEALELDRPPRVLRPGWILIEVHFTLMTPWYSKDDRPLHLVDNPLRKDRVFGVPFMSAAAWKGLLRWSCRMHEGMMKHLEAHAFSLKEWKDEPWILHLFGNEKEEENIFSQGALFFYPTWFSKVGYELINPHSRETRAGTSPIHYEVVPSETPGVLRILYAPFPGQVEKDNIEPLDTLAWLFQSIEALLTVYGFSAKRSTGWGRAKIDNWKLIAHNDIKDTATVDERKAFLQSIYPMDRRG